MIEARLLLVEDDTHLGFLLKDQLCQNGYDVSWVKDGNLAWEKYQEQHFDLCLLDILLPGVDGIELAKRIKTRDVKIPLIFITSRSLKSDIITGFEVGCDDYIIKPFEVYQLLLKIKALLNRINGENQVVQTQFTLGNTKLNSSLQELISPSGTQKLNRTENQIMSILMASENKVVPRNYILETVWNRNDMYTSKSLDTYLYQLRKYLKQTNLILENIYGSGYVLKEKSTS